MCNLRLLQNDLDFPLRIAQLIAHCSFRFMAPTHVQILDVAALHEPSLFSPQIQGYRRLGFLSICGSPESVGKPAFRGPPGTARPGGLAEALAGTFTGRLSPIWSESNLI